MKREFSAGGIVYKKCEGLWLIRRPAPNGGYRGNLGWSFPKGWRDEKESLDEAAIREVREEGGVVAKIVSRLPTIKIFFTDRDGQKVIKFVTYFVMEYIEDAPERHDWETEEVKWVSLDEAMSMLAFKNEKKLLEKALERING